jgi:tetratricopeptide (TPR) repeat protein
MFWQEAFDDHPQNIAIVLAYSEALYFFGPKERAIELALNSLNHGSPEANSGSFRQLAIRTATWLTRAGRLDDALVAVTAGLDNQPHDLQLLLMKGDVLSAKGKRLESETVFREVVRLSPDNLQAYLGLAALAASGSQTAAQAAPSSIRHSGSRLTDLTSAHLDLKRPVVQGEMAEIQESPPGASGTLVVLIGGAYRKSFGVPIELMDRYFASRDISALYVRDGALRTVAEGRDRSSPPEVLKQLIRQAQAKLGSNRLYLAGVSAGGFEAIRLGLRGTPNGIIGISAPTNLTQSFVDSVQDTRARLLVKRFNRLYGDYELDMALPMKDHPNPPPIHLIYPIENYGDRVQAEYLGDRPNVILHPITGWKEHNVHEKLIASGELFNFFDRIIEV